MKFASIFDRRADTNEIDQDELSDLIELYTRYLRKDLTESGFRREESPPVVRYINERGTNSLILYSELEGLSDDEIGAIAVRESDYFRRLGHTLEWKVFDTDRPEGLSSILAGHGYTVEPEETVMILDVDDLPDQLSPGSGPRSRRHRACMPGGAFTLHRVTDPTVLPTVLRAVQKRAAIDILSFDSGKTPDDPDPEDHPLADELVARMTEDPESIAFFVITDAGTPVSAAWTLYFGDAPFAGLYGGSTIPEYQRRGLYRNLVTARIEAARTRGIRYLVVDAGPESRPILQNLGFRRLTTTWPVSYTPDR